MTHTGRIEDDGDFSDFYPVLPDHVDDKQRKFIQETADEVCVCVYCKGFKNASLYLEVY